MKKILWCVCLLLAACGQNAADSSAEYAADEAPMAKMAAPKPELGGAGQSITELSEPGESAAEVRKYIALRHHLSVELPADALQSSFEAAIQHCQALNCQLLSANFNKKTPDTDPSGSISARVPPRNVAVFLTGLEKSGDIIRHDRDSEDKTSQVVDADARIKNLTELRDRLRLMLSDKSAKFKDIIEVERELANTQSQLDSIVSLRKALSLETDLVAVNINFTAKRSITERSFFAPLLNALKDAGQTMVESLASLITFLANALPWVIVGIPLLIMLRKLWARLTHKFIKK